MILEKGGAVLSKAAADCCSLNGIRSLERAYARFLLCGMPDRLIVTEGGGSER